MQEGMMASFQPLPVESVVAALAALPVIQSDDASTLGAARYALARAVASGQSAEQLSQDLAAPGTWLGVDLKAVAAAAAVQADPLGPELGARRILRVSPLTPVRPVC